MDMASKDDDEEPDVDLGEEIDSNTKKTKRMNRAKETAAKAKQSWARARINGRLRLKANAERSSE